MGLKRPKRRARPYASISTTLCATKKLKRLSPAATKILLWANAQWTPLGGVGLSTKRLPGELGITRQTVCDAIRELLTAELLVVRTSAIMPGGAGSLRSPKCATYHLPQRQSNSPQRFEPGDRKLQGMWRIDSDQLKKIARDLDDLAIRIFVTVLIPHHRFDAGGIQDLNKARITARGVRDAFSAAVDPPPALRSIQRALLTLSEAGLLKALEQAAGRRAASYEPAGVAAEGLPSGRAAARAARAERNGLRTRRDQSSP